MAVSSTMTLGIIVDDTVHFMSKYLQARRDYKYNSAESVRYAFTSVGLAFSRHQRRLGCRVCYHGTVGFRLKRG